MRSLFLSLHCSTLVALLLAGVVGSAAGQAPQPSASLSVVGRSTGQSLYLPVYSHIWHGEMDKKGAPTRALMSVSVSIRNTDLSRPIRILSAQYYDTDGRKLREYVAAPRSVAPMGTLEIFVPRSDDTGGSGANFVIVWKSDAPASPPLVEGVHASLQAGRSVAFVTSAQPLPAD
jgi:hypothetical protein